MLQFIYDLINWQYFGILVTIWVVIDLVWIGRWQKLIGRIGKLITKPLIFEEDKEPNEPPLYPRRFLEQLASLSRRKPSTNEGAESSSSSEFADGLRKRVFDVENPIRPLGYVLSLVFFTFFLLGDAIVIANTMVLLRLIAPDLPPILQRLDLAILGGALLSAVVGVWMLVEMSGKGELINTDRLTDAQKRILKIFAVTVTLFSAAVMIALAVQRLISLGTLESSQTMELILSFVLYGLLAINNSLAAALTFQPAASGLIVLILLLIPLVIGILPVLAFLADVLWRLAYIVIDIVLWVLFTPIIAIPYGIGKVFGLVN